MDQLGEVANSTAAGCHNDDTTGGMTEQQTVSDFSMQSLFHAKSVKNKIIIFTFIYSQSELWEVENPTPLAGPRLNGYLFYDVICHMIFNHHF